MNHSILRYLYEKTESGPCNISFARVADMFGLHDLDVADEVSRMDSAGLLDTGSLDSSHIYLYGLTQKGRQAAER